jgi:hypothetical protein
MDSVTPGASSDLADPRYFRYDQAAILGMIA